MAQEAIEELNEYERVGTTQNVFDYIRRVGVVCLDGKEINSLILDDFPLREHINVRRAVVSMTSLSSLTGGSGKNKGIRSCIEYIKTWAIKLSNRSTKTDSVKIFYSWQATLPGSANRNLIKTSLFKAIEELNKDFPIEDRGEATLDSDTANTPGSPDIIRVILEKIDSAAIFIADITLVNKTQPNANVMFELGYAMKALGEENIIIIFNEHYGSVKDLPFDLGLKRAMLYRCDPDTDEKSTVRKELVSKLKGAIEIILSKPEH